MGFGVGFGLLHLFCLIFALGIVLFIVWAVKVLDKKRLHKWVVSFLVVGLLGMVLSTLLMFGGSGWGRDVNGVKDGRQWGFFEHCDEMYDEDDADVEEGEATEEVDAAVEVEGEEA